MVERGCERYGEYSVFRKAGCTQLAWSSDGCRMCDSWKRPYLLLFNQLNFSSKIKIHGDIAYGAFLIEMTAYCKVWHLRLLPSPI